MLSSTGVYINVIGILINVACLLMFGSWVPLLMLTIHALCLVAVVYYDLD